MSEMMIAALQAQVADLQLARKQANEVVASLMQRNLPEEQRLKLFEQVTQHMMEQDGSRSDQYRGVLRATLLGLNQMAQSTADQKIKQQMIEMIKALNIVLEDK